MLSSSNAQTDNACRQTDTTAKNVWLGLLISENTDYKGSLKLQNHLYQPCALPDHILFQFTQIRSQFMPTLLLNQLAHVVQNFIIQDLQWDCGRTASNQARIKLHCNSTVIFSQYFHRIKQSSLPITTVTTLHSLAVLFLVVT